MQFHRSNLSVNLHASQLAAAVIVWIGGVTAVSIFAEGPNALVGLGLLTAGVALITFLAARS